MALATPTLEPITGSRQVVGFRTGNEMAAISAKQINFHLMGYFPITPSTEVAELVDDPFRSLAGELRRAGGFAKDTTPFSEFLWADFLRRRMKRKDVERDFERAVEEALDLAKSDAADYLPGWCGPSPEI